MPASPIDELPRPLALALHDAGAANIVIAWAVEAERAPERVWAAGPARTLWRERFGPAGLVDDLQTLLEGAACLLGGTGWASNLEHEARIEAARRGVRSIAVIDHWVNYTARFERDGTAQLPDEIWVTDAHAAAIAEREFARTPIAIRPNAYLRQQVEAAGPAPHDGDVLFVAEPARSDWGRGRAGEFQALDRLMERRCAAGIAHNAPIRLRSHPSDPPGKYAEWIAAHSGVTLDKSPDLASALAAARWVVGMNSAALVVALAAGREVFCAIPPWGPPCTLPHDDIGRL